MGEIGIIGFLDSVLVIMNCIDCFLKFVIVVLNGIILVGGLELVFCCDFVLVVCSVKIGDVYVNYGLFLGGGGLVCLLWVIGFMCVKYFLFMGDFVDVVELVEVGFVN